jgi:hypothetical protein
MNRITLLALVSALVLISGAVAGAQERPAIGDTSVLPSFWCRMSSACGWIARRERCINAAYV